MGPGKAEDFEVEVWAPFNRCNSENCACKVKRAMDQVKSAGNSWVDAASLAGATKNGVAESVTQFATAVVSMTVS